MTGADVAPAAPRGTDARDTPAAAVSIKNRKNEKVAVSNQYLIVVVVIEPRYVVGIHLHELRSDFDSDGGQRSRDGEQGHDAAKHRAVVFDGGVDADLQKKPNEQVEEDVHLRE